MNDSLFNVEQSLMRARWVSSDVDLDVLATVMRAHDLPEPVARLLCARGIHSDDIPSFLNPTLRNDFPDPLSLVGMAECAEYLAAAVIAKKSIAIFGDFDVDGATSSAVMYRMLKAVGVEAQIYIPDRLKEGYGPNAEAFQSLRDNGADIVIVLDCGTTAFDTIAAGRAMGLEIVIIDHHEAEDELPDANFVINPKRKDDQSGFDMLAAVGVTFMVCVALNTALRAAGFYKDNGIDEPALKAWLDIVALGTVCDMVPLSAVNRLFVRQGFKIARHTNNVGLKALLDVAGVSGAVSPYTAGFVLGPRINAGSRVQQSDLGAKLLSTDDASEAHNIAWTLNDCNDKRKAIQQDMEREAIEMVEAQDAQEQSAPVIIVDDEGWHPGLSGLVAGRLKEKYKKPACVVTYAQGPMGMEGRGSGRSIAGIHIAQAFIDARNAGLIEKGGGHAMAGGFTVLPEKLAAFKAFMYEHIARQTVNNAPNVETVIDGVLSVRGASVPFVKMLQDSVGPFGQEHPEPLFVLSNTRIVSADVVGGSHIRTMISDWEGGARMKAMAFRAVDTPMGDALLKQGTSAPFHIVGRLKIDNWSGQDKVEMHITDAAHVVADDQREVG